MNRNQFVQAVATEAQATSVFVKKVLAAATAVVIDQMARGGEVQFDTLGKFKLHDRPERTARNPSTGETVTVPAKKVVKFRLGKGVKDAAV